MSRSPAVTAVLGVFALATVPVLAQVTITGIIPGYELTQTLHGSGTTNPSKVRRTPLSFHRAPFLVGIAAISAANPRFIGLFRPELGSHMRGTCAQ